MSPRIHAFVIRSSNLPRKYPELAVQILQDQLPLIGHVCAAIVALERAKAQRHQIDVRF